jgi:hypothetical protein
VTTPLTPQLERVRIAEDRFVQDLIDAEYEGEEGARQARDRAQARDARVVETFLGESTNRPGKDEGVMRALNISCKQISSKETESLRRADEQPTSMTRRSATRPRRGLSMRLVSRWVDGRAAIHDQLLQSNPDIAGKLKANDLGKLGRPKADRADPGVAEPWTERLRTPKEARGVLAELSD